MGRPRLLFLMLEMLSIYAIEIRKRHMHMEWNRVIAVTSYTVQIFPSRSRIECSYQCLRTKDCCVSSFDINTQTCAIDTSGCCHVTTEPLTGVVTMTRKVQDPRDCSDFPLAFTSGVNKIHPTPYQTFDVYCDVDNEGCAWTVFQRRYDGLENFYRNWSQYEIGFGDLKREFWIGNRHLYYITYHGYYTLRIDMEDFNGVNRYAEYTDFRVESSATSYRMTFSRYTGNAGDSLGYHKGMKFSTYNNDNDKANYSCAVENKGAWWYNACHSSNLNGLYKNGVFPGYAANGMVWRAFRGLNYSLKSSKMMLRRQTLLSD